MNILVVLVIFAILLFSVKFWQQKKENKKSERFEFIKKIDSLSLNPRQSLHLLLQQILMPEYRIHCQVALSHLISTQDKVLKRNSVQKKMDFVITDKSNHILAVIELDLRDASERKDDWVLGCLQGQHSFIRIQPQAHYDLDVIAEHLQTVCGLAVVK